jgi:hypothetical protein
MLKKMRNLPTEKTSTMNCWTTKLNVLLFISTLIIKIDSFLIQQPNHFEKPPRHHINHLSKRWEAPVTFAGTGARQVDMNQYNLALEEIENQWVANFVEKSIDSEGGVFLGVKNNRELFVDVITVILPRKSGSSLGIGLQEIAGGRNDGIGITIVTDLIKGGLAQSNKADILPGDSISSISVLRRKQDFNSGLMDSQEVIKAKIECLGYDGTVEAILGLPSVQNDNEEYVIKLKRLRRKPVVKVNLKYPPEQKVKDETIDLFAGENLRLGMLVRGVQLNDPLAKRFDTKSGGNCGAGGLCRTCAVSVIRGAELLNPQKVAEEQMLQDNPRWRLACKAFVGYGMKEGEITIQVNPRQW